MALSILVCIKAVPDLAVDGDWVLDEWWTDAGGLPSRMNTYDAHALEAALTIKDNFDDVTVDVISVGTAPARDIIRGAMAMGAGDGIHVIMETSERPAPEAVALAIASAASKRNDDLILTGAISEDLMQGVTGPLIAAALDWPCAAAAVDIIPGAADGFLAVTCELEGGMAEHIRLCLPAVVTVQTTVHQPRYPSLSNVLRSRRQAIECIVPPLAAAPSWSRAKPRGVAFPAPISDCMVIEGTPVEKADALLRLFRDTGRLK